MNRTAFFLVALFMVALSACTKQKTGGLEESNTTKNLLGAWRWVGTDGGIANNIHETPLSTGRDVVLTLSGTGTYTISVNDTALQAGTYTLATKTCIHDGREKTALLFSNQPSLLVEAIDANTLNLSDENYDGTGSQYTRTTISSK